MGMKNFWIATLVEEHNTHVPIFMCASLSFHLSRPELIPRSASSHAGRYWTRLSAQVYNELDDFKDGAVAVKDVCKRLNEGEWRKVAEAKAAEGGRRALPLH